MAKIIILSIIIVLLALFIYQLKNYLARDKKIAELKETRLQSHLLDIDKEIAEEKNRQKDVESEIEDITAQQEHSNKDSNNE